jgi:hypothetical protein
MGRYTGTLKKTITIKQKNIKNGITVSAESATYIKTGATPKVTVKRGSTVLVEGVDYTVTYKNNKKVCTDLSDPKPPTAVIRGIGNYKGTNYTGTFIIKKGKISQTEAVAKDVTYNASGKNGYFMVTPKLYDNGKALSMGNTKDILTIKKDDCKFYYEKAVTLANGETRPAGSEVLKTDKLKGEASIRVVATVTCTDVSPYTQDKTSFTAYYKVVKP